jgi:hypothetical protein
MTGIEEIPIFSHLPGERGRVKGRKGYLIEYRDISTKGK